MSKGEAMDRIIEIMADMTKIEPPTDEEFQAVCDWMSAEKDGIPSPLKEGLMKLINREERRRLIEH